jgi:predicted nucleotidyltransferase
MASILSSDSMTSDLASIRERCEETRGLDLLLLHGSRARGDDHEGSDWDFGWIGGKKFDLLGFLAELTAILKTDDIDLADLSRANGLLRYLAAVDGVLVYERHEGAFDDYRVRAVGFWLDIKDIVAPGREEFLAGLGS